MPCVRSYVVVKSDSLYVASSLFVKITNACVWYVASISVFERSFISSFVRATRASREEECSISIITRSSSSPSKSLTSQRVCILLKYPFSGICVFTGLSFLINFSSPKSWRKKRIYSSRLYDEPKSIVKNYWNCSDIMSSWDNSSKSRACNSMDFRYSMDTSLINTGIRIW